MNYIHQLKRGIACRDAQLRSIDQSVTEFISFLHSPKFVGDENGQRKDWIAVGDVLTWLRQCRSDSIMAGESAAAQFNPNQEPV